MEFGLQSKGKMQEEFLLIGDSYKRKTINNISLSKASAILSSFEVNNVLISVERIK